MQEHRFPQRLEKEFLARRGKNPRYSLRAFARFLGADHSVLSQVLRGVRRAPAVQIRKWAKKLQITQEEAAVYIAAEHLPAASTAGRQEQLRHWTSEGLSVTADTLHWEIVRLSRTPGFRTDCRWIAEKNGCTVDAVNLALARLLRLQLIELSTSGNWKDLSGARSEREFRKLALVRVRQMAAEAKVTLK